VFAASAIDPGTKLLLLESPPPPTGPVDVLDLGCGYGPIALTIARRAPEATVWAVDVNQRALELCALNAAANGVTNVRAVTPDAVPRALRLAGIWSNPPIRIGKPALHELLLSWLGRLEDDAAAWLVVQKHLGADSLARWLGENGWPAQPRVARTGYRVLEVGRA
jgi:16S rRNA (guanine1207-N2)-methyltransferase